MQCRSCGAFLHIIKGGQKIKDGKIIMVHVLGCLNRNCQDKMVEQGRKETEAPRFAE